MIDNTMCSPESTSTLPRHTPVLSLTLQRVMLRSWEDELGCLAQENIRVLRVVQAHSEQCVEVFAGANCTVRDSIDEWKGGRLTKASFDDACKVNRH